jgi:hypothetical protein
MRTVFVVAIASWSAACGASSVPCSDDPIPAVTGSAGRPAAVHPPPAPPVTLDACLTDVYADSFGTFIRLADGSILDVARPHTTYALHPTNHVPEPASRVPPRASGYVTATAEPATDSIVIALRDERDHSLGEHRVAMPASPAIDDDGQLTTGPGTRCAIGVSDMTWTDRGAVIVSIHYSVSDLCDGDGLGDVCSLAVLDLPKDLPAHD